MKKIPPHLPAPVCSIADHERLARIKLFLISVVAGLASGLIGALFIVSAWYPTAQTNTTVVLPNRSSAPTLDSSLVREWRPRLVDVYDNSKIVTTGYYLESARLGKAVVVNAGGWSVMPLIKLNKATVIGLDYQGHELTVEEIVADEKQGLTYIKFSGADFRATASFATRSVVQTGRLLWGLGSEWQAFTVGQKISNQNPVTNVTDNPVVYPLRELGAANRVLITDRGEFVGFSSSNSVIVPVWMAPEILPKIMSDQKPPFLSLGWQGSFVTAVRVGSETMAADGFLITEISKSTVTNDTIKKGDIIIAIQGQSVTAENIFELIMLAPTEFTVTVLRDSVTQSLTVKK